MCLSKIWGIGNPYFFSYSMSYLEPSKLDSFTSYRFSTNFRPICRIFKVLFFPAVCLSEILKFETLTKRKKQKKKQFIYIYILLIDGHICIFMLIRSCKFCEKKVHVLNVDSLNHYEKNLCQKVALIYFRGFTLRYNIAYLNLFFFCIFISSTWTKIIV